MVTWRSGLCRSVNIAIEEKVVKLDREGGLQSVEVLGNLGVTVADTASSVVRVQCTPLDANLFQLKVASPHLLVVRPPLTSPAAPAPDQPQNQQGGVHANRSAGADGPSRGLPIGSSQVLVKWRMPPSVDESKVPLMGPLFEPARPNPPVVVD